VDWNGNGSLDDPEAILGGDQCLVFFLGGIPVPPSSGSRGTQGFSTNPANPAQPGGNRRGPFFNFDESRLIELAVIHPPGFYSYQDPYRNAPRPLGPDWVFGVYAYFSAFGRVNGYNRRGVFDCDNLGVYPYAEVSNHDVFDPNKWRYLNAKSFQIISPGADGRFGQGSDPGIAPRGNWSPSTASSSAALGCFLCPAPPATLNTGADDISNFYDKLLGTSE